MTEAEWFDYWNRRDSLAERDWLICPYSRPMLSFIQTKASDRKLKLFDVACCHIIWFTLNEATGREVEAWERFAEGAITQEELASASSVSWCDPGDLAWSAAIDGEEMAQAHLLRDIIGNPFKPVTINLCWLAWNDCTVVKLAQGIYDDRAFDRLHILADALEDAGCTNSDIVCHCRHPGPHVRGCWVVDLLLGKG
jgi:hypothetical protein